MLPGLTQNEQRQQFQSELKAHIRAQQGAEGVCRLLGTCVKEHQLCMVMRWYQRSLAEKIGVGELEGNVNEVRRIAQSLCRTLAQLHDAGLIVQDIKPQNILLGQYDQPVFADFGVAGLVNRTTKLMPTSVKGTFNYMAPEAFEPPLGTEADIWSLGCVILEMLTGCEPWAGLQMQQIMMAVVIRRRAPEVPEVLDIALDEIRRCFAFNPGERPTATELAEAMKPASAQEAMNTERRRKVKAMTTTLQNQQQQLPLEFSGNSSGGRLAILGNGELYGERYEKQMSFTGGVGIDISGHRHSRGPIPLSPVRAVQGKRFEGGAYQGQENIMLAHTAKELYMLMTNFTQTALGQGEPELVHALARETDEVIVRAFAGCRCGGFITSFGRVFTAGHGNWGSCHPYGSDADTKNTFRLIDGLAGKFIVHIRFQCYAPNTIAVSASGELLEFQGLESLEWKSLEPTDDLIEDIATSIERTLRYGCEGLN